MFSVSGRTTSPPSPPGSGQFHQLTFLITLITLYSVSGAAAGDKLSMQELWIEALTGATIFTVGVVLGSLLIAEAYLRITRGETLWP